MIWKISRYWNRLAYFVMGLGLRMVWDQTGLNQDILKDEIDPTARAILCDYDFE